MGFSQPRSGHGQVGGEGIEERLAAADDTAAQVITGDSTVGHHEGAPYDLLISTVCVQQVPPARVAQVRAGGRILTIATPLGSVAGHDLSSGGARAVRPASPQTA